MQTFKEILTESKKVYKVTYYSDKDQEHDIGSVYVYAKNNTEAERKTKDVYKKGSYESVWSSEMHPQDLKDFGISKNEIMK